MDTSPTIKKIVTIMKLTTLGLILFALNISATVYSQQTKLSLNANNISIKEVLYQIESKSDYRFIYEVGKINVDKKVSIHVKEKTIDYILSNVFGKEGVKYEITDHNLILINPTEKSKSVAPAISIGQQKQKRISGTVVDSNGQPIIGANVVEKGTTNGIITDVDGKFALNVSSSSVLQISYLGYLTQEIAIKNKNNLDVKLIEDTQKLDEVVVVGYGTVKKRDLTGAVSSVKMDDTPTNTITTVSHALAGKVAGLQVTQNSAQVGGGSTFRIRGAASTGAGNDPLIIIDGFPVSSSSTLSSGTIYNAGSTDNLLESINPNDIESIEVLKDASATAIYGSRAGHGVVIITTKRGKSQKASVTYSGSVSFQTIAKNYDMLNAQDFMRQRNEYSYEVWLKQNAKDIYKDYITLNSSHVEKPYAPYYTEEEIAAKTDGTDWVGAVTRTGEQQSHNVSLRGGTEKTNYMASVNYMYQNGIVKNNDMNRITGLFNLDQTISSIFKTGFSLNVSHNKYDNVELGNGEDELSGIIASAAGFDPCLPIYDENGNYTINPYISFVPNPVSLLNIKDKTVKDRILASAYLQAEPIKGLVLKVNVGVDRRNQTRKNYIPKTTLVGQNVNGEANIYQNESTDYLMDLTANYNKTLGANNINALLGYSYQEFNNEGFNAGNEGFLTDEFLYYNIGAGQYSKPWVGSSGSKGALGSYFGRINYSLLDRYLCTLTLRTDGASNFEENHRWGWFPSVALGWRFSEESFFKPLSNIISNGKLRISYGTTGNSNIGNRTLNFYQTGVYTVFGTTPHIQVYNAQMGNPKLTWEKTKEFNLGLDLGLLNNRISLVAEFFNRTISDLLVSGKALMSYNEISSIAANIGETQSSGYELTLNTENIVTNDFSWSTALSLSHYNDRWKNRDPDWKPAVYQSAHDPIRAIYSYVSDGLMQVGEKAPAHQKSLLPGQIKLKDLNNDGKLNDYDKVLIGKNDPSLIFGLNNILKYKRFDLSFYFYGELNRLMAGSYYENLARGGSNGNWIESGRNLSSGYVKRWSYKNQSSKYPTTIASDFGDGDYYYKKISYLRMRNIMLGYKVPITPKIAQSLRLYIDINNPFIFTNWSGLDPETDNGNNYAYPNVRSFSFGLDINF